MARSMPPAPVRRRVWVAARVIERVRGGLVCVGTAGLVVTLRLELARPGARHVLGAARRGLPVVAPAVEAAVPRFEIAPRRARAPLELPVGPRPVASAAAELVAGARPGG